MAPEIKFSALRRSFENNTDFSQIFVLFHGRLHFDSPGCWGPEWCARIFTAQGKDEGRSLTLLQTCDNIDLVLKLSQKIRQCLRVKEELYAQKYFVC